MELWGFHGGALETAAESKRAKQASLQPECSVLSDWCVGSGYPLFEQRLFLAKNIG